MQQLAYRDFTLKAVLSDSQSVVNLLKKAEATFLGVDHQTDTYFETEKGKLKLRLGTIENLITHYERISENGFESTVVYRYDKDPTPAEIEELHQHHRVIGKTEKERSIYFLSNVKIHLDRLPDGQEFIEIEAMDTENSFSDFELKEQCHTLRQALEISEEQLILTGYLTA
jgi:adenylate cyclase class 2